MEPKIILDNPKKNIILFKVIGSPNFGLGHVVRSLELAHEFKKNTGNEIFFYCNKNIVTINKISQQFPVFFPDLEGDTNKHILDIIKKYGINTVIIDHMDADPELCKAFKSQNPEILIVALDSCDYSNRYIDIIINLFNHDLKVPHPEELFTGRYYEGLQYAIIRDSFLPYLQKPRMINDKIESILISHGSADKQHHTRRIISFLQKSFPKITLHVIIGALNEDRDLTSQHSENSSNCKIYRDVIKIEQLMDRADIGFVGAGSTLLELCSLGVPAVVTPQNDFELRFSKFIEKKKACLVVDGTDDQKNKDMIVHHILENKKIRQEMSEFQKKLIDGKGKERIAQIIRSTLEIP
jgi:spore coat polysaccharide biosynthesis predicted glycosyltransferase SpsG